MQFSKKIIFRNIGNNYYKNSRNITNIKNSSFISYSKRNYSLIEGNDSFIYNL